MAIVKFGVLVVGARGTIGGATFTANQTGPFVRQWSKGSNPRTSKQSEQRGLIGTLASSWRALSTAQQDDWDDYALLPPQEKTNSLGETYVISGFLWYVAINQNLTAAGAALRVDAPTLTRPTAPIIQDAFLYVTGHVNNTAVQYTVADPDVDALHGVHAKVVNSQGIRHIPDKMPFIILLVPNVIRAINIESEIEAEFGTIALGQRMLLSTFIQDAHGQRGPTDTTAVDAINP